MAKQIEINDDFQKALDLMESDEKFIMVSGGAGTGKSTLLKYFRQNTKKKIAVLAPTGVAALNVQGQTIHSFFRLPFGIIDSSMIKRKRTLKKILEKLDSIIIDEISMVRADVMDAIDISIRLYLDKAQPFGGLQIITIGDLFQLPPVVTDNDVSFNLLYETPFFFSSNVVRNFEVKAIILNKIYRQTNNSFKELLNRLRHGAIEPTDIEELNSRFKENIKVRDLDNNIVLASTNYSANKINKLMMDRLKTKQIIYEADIDGDFPENIYPTELELELKEGAQILMIKNDPDKRWFNGSIGKIIDLKKDEVLVEIDGMEHTVEKESWVNRKYTFNKVEEEELGEFQQFPMKASWAITIHKSQGKTFNNTIIDLGSGAFAAGQTYVALSRNTSLEGIILKRRLTFEDIIVDEKILEFYEKVSLV
jgi:ATP-dependent exoDNAse (exonuclease V) alpha subunit